MAVKKEQWQANDGKTFDTEAEADVHDRNLAFASAGDAMEPWIEKYLKLTGRYKTDKRIPSEVARYKQFAVAMMSYQQDGDLLVDSTIEHAPAKKPETDQEMPPEMKGDDNLVSKQAAAKKPSAKKTAAKA